MSDPLTGWCPICQRYNCGQHYLAVAPAPAPSPEAGASPLVEQVAALAHEAWSGWMRYLFGRGIKMTDGAYLIGPEEVKRWTRQINTHYAELPENEKESDRVEARRYLAPIQDHVATLTAALAQRERELAEARAELTMALSQLELNKEALKWAEGIVTVAEEQIARDGGGRPAMIFLDVERFERIKAALNRLKPYRPEAAHG